MGDISYCLLQFQIAVLIVQPLFAEQTKLVVEICRQFSDMRVTGGKGK